MAETSPATPPEKLYRGVIIPADALTEGIFHGDITPGSTPSIDEQGRQTVDDGNEYGVYMTDNAHMAEVAYATPRRGDTLPNSPKFNWENASQSEVQAPRVGILHEIDTTGLEVRKPFITDSLRGVYNNGFQGDEWIADQVPAANHRVTKLQLGSDMLHPAQDFEVRGNTSEILDAVRAAVAERIAKLGLAAQIIEGMPGNRRHFPGMVERELSKHEALRDTTRES